MNPKGTDQPESIKKETSEDPKSPTELLKERRVDLGWDDILDSLVSAEPQKEKWRKSKQGSRTSQKSNQ